MVTKDRNEIKNLKLHFLQNFFPRKFLPLKYLEFEIPSGNELQMRLNQSNITKRMIDHMICPYTEQLWFKRKHHEIDWKDNFL